MKYFTKLFPFSLILIFFCVYIAGCVNLEQKTIINSDGSGSMKIKYWTKTNNITGDELGVFGFSEEKVESNYFSPYTYVSGVNIEKDATIDSFTVVTLNLNFKDFNKISEAKSFSQIKASYGKSDNGMQFKYILLQDTSNANTFGASDYKLTYEFEFPSEVIMSNGKTSGNTVTWKKTVADLKEDVEFMAYIKSE